MTQRQVNKLIWNLSWGFGLNELLYALDPSSSPHKENNNSAKKTKKKQKAHGINLSQGESTRLLKKKPLMRDERAFISSNGVPPSLLLKSLAVGVCYQGENLPSAR